LRAAQLVTGATSGIGEAIARRLTVEGGHIVICGRRSDRLEGLASELGRDRVTPIVCDIADPSSIETMFANIRKTLGGVDILVNNAGLGHNAPLMSGATEDWQDMLNVNVLGLAVCTREAVSDIRRRGDNGHVVHISSMSGHRVPESAGTAMYAASKHAVKAMTEGLRLELRQAGSPIRVSSISPGFTRTEFAGKYFQNEDMAEETYSRYKVLEARDIADAVDYVLSCPPHMQVHDILIRPTDQLS
jgi:NADP-dependent 3-hydroxy acid dehydrogenase YdfG